MSSPASSDYVCAFCLEPPIAPRIAPCGDVFCHECWQTYLRTEESARPDLPVLCPLCRERIPLEQAFKAPVVRAMLNGASIPPPLTRAPKPAPVVPVESPRRRHRSSSRLTRMARRINDEQRETFEKERKTCRRHKSKLDMATTMIVCLWMCIIPAGGHRILTDIRYGTWGDAVGWIGLSVFSVVALLAMRFSAYHFKSTADWCERCIAAIDAEGHPAS